MRESTLMAQDKIKEFFAGIPEAETFITDMTQQLARNKFVATILGRRRWFYDTMSLDDSEEHLERARAKRRKLCWCPKCKLSRDGERAGRNHKIQGTAADIVMIAMVRCSQDPELRRLGVHLLLQIHDELVFEAPDENVEEACPIIRYHMEHPGLPLRVPLRAPPGVGDNWDAAKA